MLRRKLNCSVCDKEIEPEETMYAKMIDPKPVMGEIRAYLQKKSEVICEHCFDALKK